MRSGRLPAPWYPVPTHARADGLIAETLSDTALYAMARKAKESPHAGEREAFGAKLKSLGHDPEEILSRRARIERPSAPSSSPRDDWMGGMQPRRRSRSGAARRPHSPSTPEWAWAGYSGGMPPFADIYRPTYDDLNHIKKTMWEKSGKSKTEHTVHQFDGRYWRHSFTAFGNEKIYPEMAKAMKQWGEGANPYRTKAIFISKRGSKKYNLVWANGKDVPVGQHSFEHPSPQNDHRFNDSLSQWVDDRVP